MQDSQEIPLFLEDERPGGTLMRLQGNHFVAENADVISPFEPTSDKQKLKVLSSFVKSQTPRRANPASQNHAAAAESLKLQIRSMILDMTGRSPTSPEEKIIETIGSMWRKRLDYGYVRTNGSIELRDIRKRAQKRQRGQELQEAVIAKLHELVRRIADSVR